MCKITCSLKEYTPCNNLTFYHSVRCDKFISKDAVSIEKLKEIAKSYQGGDWANSMYLAYKKEVAEGYIENNYDKGIATIIPHYMIELKLISNLQYIECSDERFGEGKEENIKVSKEDWDFITEKLGKNTTNLSFMNYLGEKRYAFECYHDLDKASDYNKELIVPSQLVTKTIFEIKNCKECFRDDIKNMVVY